MYYATKTTLNSLRSDEELVTVWEVAVSLAEKCGIAITPPRPRCSQRPPRQLEESFVVTTDIAIARDRSCEDYSTQVYFALVIAIFCSHLLPNTMHG